MKVSIVTVCYNSEQTIRQTIESVLDQRYPDIEYIIIDGQSTDGTMAIIAEYRERIDLLVSEPDRGIYDAMNKGIKMASGDVIGILNSDDVFYDDQVIGAVAEVLRKDSTVDGVYGDLIYVDREDLDKQQRFYSSNNFSQAKIRFGLMLPHPTLYLRRELFVRYGLYKLTYRVAADFEYIARLFTNGVQLRRLPRIMVKMRSGGISSNGFWWRIHQNLEIVRACRENGIYTNLLLVAAKIPCKLFSYFPR